MAALCHDIGHLAFSHSTERELLPSGYSHEHLTADIIRSAEMERILGAVTPPLRSDDVVKLAVGPKILRDTQFTDWEAILSEIIVGDAFGCDRMDYLLRDSLHIGVAYGKFDHFRLIDTLRILPASHADSEEPCLGIEEGGLHSAEALLLARYFMNTQVYYHPVRRIYDIHLRDFLKRWLGDSMAAANPSSLLVITDVQVMNTMMEAARASDHPCHELACLIMDRKHFRLAYQLNSEDRRLHPEPGRVMFNALQDKFGQEHVRRDAYTEKRGVLDFPVLERNGRIVSSMLNSRVLQNLPTVEVDFVFADPQNIDEAKNWLEDSRVGLLEKAAREERE